MQDFNRRDVAGGISWALPAITLAAAAPATASSTTAPVTLGCADPMVMTWDTTQSNGTAEFFVTGASGPLTIDWGGPGMALIASNSPASDQVQQYTGGTYVPTSYQYSTPGTYTVRVCGTAATFGLAGAAAALTDVNNFGTLGAKKYTFHNASNLTSVPAALPDTVTSTSGMFQGATKFNQSLSTWDTIRVTDMSSMFDAATSFNQPVDTWNTQNVTDMGGCSKGRVFSISRWARGTRARSPA